MWRRLAPALGLQVKYKSITWLAPKYQTSNLVRTNRIASNIDSEASKVANAGTSS
jgi:hypothetical protein